MSQTADEENQKIIDFLQVSFHCSNRKIKSKAIEISTHSIGIEIGKFSLVGLFLLLELMNLNYNFGFYLGLSPGCDRGPFISKASQDATPKQLNEERKTILAFKLIIANSLRFALQQMFFHGVRNIGASLANTSVCFSSISSSAKEESIKMMVETTGHST